MKKLLSIGLVALLMGLACSMDDLMDEPELDVEEGTIIEAITALGLLAIYEENEIAGDAQFKGKILDITGQIADLSVGLFNTQTLTFGDGSLFALKSVKCTFSDEEAEKLIPLRKGQTVTARGKVDGMMLGMRLEVESCSIRSGGT